MLDPDLEIGGEGRSSRLLEKGGGGGEVSKIFFKPFRPQFGLKISGGLGPPDPSPGSATAAVHLTLLLYSYSRVHG